MSATCGTCRFYSGGGMDGQCRRNPPRCEIGSLHGIWPSVTPRQWCGEYESNREITTTFYVDDHGRGDGSFDEEGGLIDLKYLSHFQGSTVEVTIREAKR